MTIRDLLENDVSAWSRLWQKYQSFYQVSLAPDVCEKTFKRLLDPNEPMRCVIVQKEDIPVGFVHFIYHRSCWTVGDYCYLQDLFVDEEERGRGLGRKLIEHVYHEASSFGAARVYWLTHSSNAQAMMLYDQVADRTEFVHYKKNI